MGTFWSNVARCDAHPHVTPLLLPALHLPMHAPAPAKQLAWDAMRAEVQLMRASDGGAAHAEALRDLAPDHHPATVVHFCNEWACNFLETDVAGFCHELL